MSLSRSAFTAAAGAALVVALAACSGGEPLASSGTTVPVDTAEEEPPTGADPAPETGGDEPVADGEPSVDPDDSRFGADLDTTAQAIVDSLENATGYVVVGSTVTITFSEGEAEGLDGMMDCLSVGGLLTEDETLVLAYPDGEKTC